VEEKNRAWTSSNKANDNVAVTIEVANCKGAPNWEVSSNAYLALIELCYDICRRNGIKKLNYTGTKDGNLTTHNMFSATSCPGNYLLGKMQRIAEEVNERLADNEKTYGGFLVAVTASALNVRAGAGIDYPINTVVKKNEVFTIVDTSGNWGKLKSGAGWVNLKYTRNI
jgi:uncharacterized protein YgiM (DUF1202 family)